MNQKTVNPKISPSLPIELEKQLSTINGAEALALKYQEQARNTDDEGQREYFGRCASAAKQQVNYLSFLCKVGVAKKARAESMRVAADRVKECRDEASRVNAALAELSSSQENTAAKIADLISSVNRKEQELIGAETHARQQFELAMNGDDDAKQRVAAENLSRAGVDLGMFRQHGPDNLRLRVLEARSAESITAIQSARQELGTAEEALHQALFKEKLINLDEAFDQVVQAWTEAINAQRDCAKRPFLAHFDSIVLWASSEKHITSAKRNPSDASTPISGPLMYPLLDEARRPDLSVFCEQPK